MALDRHLHDVRVAVLACPWGLVFSPSCRTNAAASSMGPKPVSRGDLSILSRSSPSET